MSSPQFVWITADDDFAEGGFFDVNDAELPFDELIGMHGPLQVHRINIASTSQHTQSIWPPSCSSTCRRWPMICSCHPCGASLLRLLS